jgi:hypothetical protein
MIAVLLLPASTMIGCSKSDDKNTNLQVPDVPPAGSASGKGGPVNKKN